MRQVLLRPSPLKKQKSRKTFNKFLFFIFVLIIFYIGLGFLSHIKGLVINEVNIFGNKIVSSDEIKNKTLSFLSGNKGLFYAKGNIFLFSKKEINNFLLKEFPRIFDIKSIERKKQTIFIEIEERNATYLWCGMEKPIYENRFSEKDCYFVDQKGFIFDKAPFFTEGVYLIIYGGIDEKIDPIGQTIQTQNSMQDFDLLIEKVKGDGFNIHSIVLNSLDTSEYYFLLDLQTQTGDFAKIIFNEYESLTEVLNKIILTKEEEEFSSNFQKNKEKLEYIDTRFKNRIFYKFLNE